MTKKNKQESNAIYARGILTIDLPNAKEPVLWRQEIRDLTQVSFALQILANGDRALVLRANDGAEQIIATFDNQDTANEALAALRGTLLKSQTDAAGTAIRKIWKILKWVLVLLIIWFCLRFAFNVYVNMMAAQVIENVKTGQTTGQAPPEGVPLIADDYLKDPGD